MRSIVTAATFALTVVAVTIGCHRPTPPPPDTGPVAVTVATPLSRKVTTYTELTGNLQAVQSVDVRPRVSGYIEKVNFTDGSEVKEGDVLVEIDPRVYQAAFDQANGQVEVNQKQLELAEADYKRFAKLMKTGSIAQEEFDKSAAQVKVDAARIDVAKADLEQARLNLDWTKVTAPISGQVDRIRLTRGNVATGGTAQGTILTTIKSDDPIYAYLNVDERRVREYLNRKADKWYPGVVAGPVAVVSHDFLEPLVVEVQLVGETGYPHKGKIDFASNALDPSTGTLQLRGELPNPGPARTLKPGMYVKARIPGDEPIDAILIPDDAIVSDQADKTVYVVTANNKVESRRVILGPRALGLRVVSEGLKPDDRIVIRGLQRVADGQTVDPQPGKIEPRGDVPTDTSPTSMGD